MCHVVKVGGLHGRLDGSGEDRVGTITDWGYRRWFERGIILVGDGYFACLTGVDHAPESIQSQIMLACDWVENLNEMLSELGHRAGCILSEGALVSCVNSPMFCDTMVDDDRSTLRKRVDFDAALENICGLSCSQYGAGIR